MILLSIRRGIGAVALAFVVVTAAAEWLLAILRPEEGPLGVLQLVAPHLALAGLAASVAVLTRLSRSNLVAVAALAIVVVTRFGGAWVSLPPAPPAADAVRIDVATWNLEVGSRSGPETVAMLRDHEADIVALQELRPDIARAIDGDQELALAYPYRSMAPRDDIGGMAILSRFPLADRHVRLDPVVQSATADLGRGLTIDVVNAHPFHADIATLGSTRLPIGLDSAKRNADLETIRAQIDGAIAIGLPVLLLGDLNTADSEPAFDRFVAGLHDVHDEVGEGTGWTWRPIRLEFLGLGLFRIDHVIVSPGIAPTGTGVTCPAVGDHCLVQASLAISGG